MKYACLPLLLAFGLALPASGQTLRLADESRLWIDGTSSLHDWTCAVEDVSGRLESPGPGLAGLRSVEIEVPVKGIACKNGTMNKKTYAALDQPNHPTIRYRLLQATVGPDLTIETTGTLTMAGATREIGAAVRGERLADGRYRFMGEVPLRMSDFGIEPPTAMFGTLKTGDAVTVRFELVAALADVVSK